MENFQKLNRTEMKNVLGGVNGGTSCSASCPSGQEASITNCIGTCTGYTGYAECVGKTGDLKKNCA